MDEKFVSGLEEVTIALIHVVDNLTIQSAVQFPEHIVQVQRQIITMLTEEVVIQVVPDLLEQLIMKTSIGKI